MLMILKLMYLLILTHLLMVKEADDLADSEALVDADSEALGDL